jgi:leucyl/phenylalanyl-tRNA--protein transferase
VLLINENGLYFPDPREADDEGLVACGGDFSPERLIFAYSLGIFPWFNEGEQIFWFSPNPRMVLYPSELRIAKSMRPYFNQQKFTFSIDKAFSEVINACAVAERKNQGGETWISQEIMAAYTEMHKLGYAHSAEVWDENGVLVGGLYGIALGKVFFGESMFSKVSNASKFGFISLVEKLSDWGFALIDCQQETAHLVSMGAKTVSRDEFMEMLHCWVALPPSSEAFPV